jgi:hypothetical protein
VLEDVCDEGGLGNGGNGSQFAATSRGQIDRSMANTRFNRAIQLIGVVGALDGAHRSTVCCLPWGEARCALARVHWERTVRDISPGVPWDAVPAPPDGR